MKTLNVDLGERSYPIYIGQDILGSADSYKNHIRGRQVLVVTNQTIAPLYLASVVGALAEFDVSTLILKDGEQHKKMETIELVFDRLLEEKHNRTTT